VTIPTDKSVRLPPPDGHGQLTQLIPVSAASFVVWSGFGAILPYLTVFLNEEAHASYALISYITAAYFVSTFFFSSVLGRLSDTIGRKPMMVIGTSLYAVATLLFVTTTHAEWFILFRFLEGLGAAAVGPAGQAFVADITTEKNRSRAYGWLTTAQFGGLVAGPAMALPLYSLGGGQGKWAFYTIFLFGSALSAAMAVVLLLAIKEPKATARRRHELAREREERETVLEARRSPVRSLVTVPLKPFGAVGNLLGQYRRIVTAPILAFIVVASTGNFAMGVWDVLWSLYLVHLGASIEFVGWTWIAFSVPMLFSWVGGRIADRGNRFLLMFSGYAISAVAWVVYGTTSNLTVFIVFSVIEGTAVAYSFPAKQTFLVQVSPRRWLGSIQGLESTSMQFAALIGTFSAPWFYALIGGKVIALAGLISLAGLAIAAPILRREWARIKSSEAVPSSTEVETAKVETAKVLTSQADPTAPDGS
jgi:DHA1 family multidrug resistance protein-like MFS transporter